MEKVFFDELHCSKSFAIILNKKEDLLVKINKPHGFILGSHSWENGLTDENFDLRSNSAYGGGFIYFSLSFIYFFFWSNNVQVSKNGDWSHSHY